MRPGFEFPQGTNAWMSYSIDESLPNPVPNYVRLAPGATAAMIQNALPSVSVVRLREYLRPQEAWALALVLVNCVLLLVVAWTQAGGIASARAWDRLGEFALRRALGATEMQLRLLTTSEVAVAAALIMAISWTLSFPLVAAVVGLLPGEMSAGLNVSPGIGAFGFALTVLLVGSMLMVSLSWAAIRAASHNALWLAPAFTTRPRRSGNVQSMVLATQAALVTTLALLAGASFKSFAEVQRIGLGFDPKGLFALVTPVPSPDPAAEELGRQRVKQSLEAVRGLPGVIHAALAGAWPLADPLVRRLITVNGPDPLEVIVQYIGVGYPATIGARLIEGREAVVDEARPLLSSGSVASVGLVNESLARRLQYRGSAVGQVVSLSASTTVRIVGVIEDIEDSRLDGQVPPTLYRYRSDEVSGAQLLVRLDDVGSMPQVRATLDAVWGADASAISVVSVADVRTRLTVNHRARSMLMGLVTFICIPLTVWGIGGMVHDEIARSARDFAIRLALGAGHLHLRRRFLTKLLTLALSGVVAGSLLGISLVRLLGAFRSVASVDAALVSSVGVSAAVIVLSSAVYGLRHLSRITPADLFRSGM